MNPLRSKFDALFLDLDGTLYTGKEPIDGAADALRGGSEALYFVTNNASRSVEQVAEHLSDLGFEATADFVVTSAQSAIRLLTEQIPAGSAVLVVGSESLATGVENAGLRPVRTATERPAAVVQGHSPDTGWGILAEASFAIRAGAVWIACNTDATLPTERGLAPGNGSMVAAVRTATGAQPTVAGKPAAPIMEDALARSKSESPLVVGDRLDTDIEGANAVDLPSLLVLTGVSTALELLHAPPEHRPTYVGATLDVLNEPAERSAFGPRELWRTSIADGVLEVEYTGTGNPDLLDALRVACPTAWGASTFHDVRGRGDIAASAVSAWHRSET